MNRRGFLKTILAGALAPVVAKIGNLDGFAPTIEGARTNLVLNSSGLQGLEGMSNTTGFCMNKLFPGTYRMSYDIKLEDEKVWTRCVDHYNVVEEGPAQILVEITSDDVVMRNMQFEMVDGRLDPQQSNGILFTKGVDMRVDYPPNTEVRMELANTTVSDTGQHLYIRRTKNG